MSYITTYKPAKGASISLDQMLGSTVDISVCRKPRPYPGTVTRRCETPPYAQGDVRRLIELLKRLPYIHTPRNLHKEYKIYTIPKRSGGERKICAPSETLYRDQVTLRTLFEKEFFASYHTTAFAYCKGRNSKRCLQRHQANKSRWFLKLDFEDFFGNTSKEFVMQQLANTIKKLLTGNGKAEKQEVANALTAYIGEHAYRNDDESDAAAVAVAWLISHNQIKQIQEDTPNE